MSLSQFLFRFFSLFVSALLPIAASAQSSGGGSGTGATKGTIITSKLTKKIGELGLGATTPDVVTAKIVVAVIQLLGIIALILIIYGGFRWMFARGNEEEVRSARGILFGAFIGLAIILASYGIALYIFGVLYEATGV